MSAASGPPSIRPAAAIVTIGDELLSGDREDSNSTWLAAFLSDAGFSVGTILTVGDDPESIAEALRIANSRAARGLVLVTGGLGPTLDDCTRDAVAELLGIPLQEDPALLDRLRSRFAARGIDPMPATNRRIARIPEGAEVLPNEVGSAPGLVLDWDGSLLVLLPGVPAEMKHLARSEVAGLLDRRFGRLAGRKSVVLRTTGIAESALAEAVEAVLPRSSSVNLAWRPSVWGVDLVLTARDTESGSGLERAVERLMPVLDGFRYEAPSGDLAEAVLLACRPQGLSLATAESCTGGMVAARLTGHAGSSDVVLGGVVAYSNEAKVDLLDVPPALIGSHGAVSGPVAEAMAVGARSRLGSDLAVSVTGIAGPGGGTAAKPVGTVWFGVAGPEGVSSERRILPGTRTDVRERAGQHALHLLLHAANPAHDAG